MNADSNYSELEELSRRGRWLVLSTVAGSGAGHVGGPMSAMDLLISLFFRGMDIRPEEPNWTERGQRKQQRFHTFVMIGDGELQEGMVWEALHVAPRYQLGNLTAILDSNGLQQFGWLKQQDSDGWGDRRDPWIWPRFSQTWAGVSLRSTVIVSKRSFRRFRKVRPSRWLADHDPCPDS
jgi:transketolase N-terminal domain/subunit